MSNWHIIRCKWWSRHVSKAISAKCIKCNYGWVIDLDTINGYKEDETFTGFAADIHSNAMWNLDSESICCKISNDNDNEYKFKELLR